MTDKNAPKHMGRSEQKSLEGLSPFELKDKFITLAGEHAKMAGAAPMLNAGRGNPNWIATTPREAFFVLGQFALTESKRVWEEQDLGGMPAKDGIADRLAAYLAKNGAGDGAKMLKDAVAYGVKTLGFNADAFVHELTDSIIGDNYPVPDRMLKHAEALSHAYLMQEMCGSKPPKGRFDIFAVEGGTAAMCYIFNTLQENRLLRRGDTIAIGAPIFTPYIEMPQLDQYGLNLITIDASETRADGTHTWQYPDSEIDKLADPKVKALFLVNPSNPPSVAVRQETIDRIVNIVKTKNPNLIIITDDVYGTFIDNFRSLMADLPQNTIGVYSYSKYFGATGWRLGVVAVHQDNIYDRMLAALPADDKKALNKRYESLTLTPQDMKFIDRMVADSRSVALNHTAGLSLPQQVQMALFSLFALLDTKNDYKELTKKIVRRRLARFWKGFDIPLPQDALRAGYYSTIDIWVGAEQAYGKEFVAYMKASYEPIDILVRLAEQFGTVLLNGSGFDGPIWSVRASLANLPDEAYEKIGQEIRVVVRQYHDEWQQSKAK